MKYITLPLGLAMGLTLTACGGKQDPATLQNMEHEMLVARDAEPVKYGEVLFGPAAPHYGEVEIKSVPRQRSCNYPKTKTGTQVVHINTNRARQVDGGPLVTITERPEQNRVHTLNGLDLGTVVVTETEHPVTLVLSSYYSTLWNIQIAPGATVESILTMSTEPSAVYAPGVKPRSIRMVSSQFNDTNKCFVTPVDYFNAEQKSKAQYVGDFKPDMKKLRAQEREYKDWLMWIERNVGPLKTDIQKVPGVGYSKDMDTRRHFSHGYKAALVGPAPAAPLHRPVISGTIYATRAEKKSRKHTQSIFVDFGSDEALQAKYPSAFWSSEKVADEFSKKLKDGNVEFIEGKVTRGGAKR